MPGALLLLLVFGLVAWLLGYSRWLAHRPWAAAGNVALGTVLFATCYALAPAAMHLSTYERLHEGETVAEVQCERTGDDGWRVTLTRLPGGRMQVYELNGEQWRIDARTLAWRGRAAQLGLVPRFRLERLSARFVHTRDGDAAADAGGATLTAVPASYALPGDDEVGSDLWSQARTGGPWRGRVDAGRAYGPWVALADGARFDVVVIARTPEAAEGRLDVRPANEAGAAALEYTVSREAPVRTPQG